MALALARRGVHGELLRRSCGGRPAEPRPPTPTRRPSSIRSTARRPGPVSPGTVGEFPGADVPFGMLQWSPDTSPNTVQAGGGYAYGDSAINGFSLTHLSGTGCPSYQDVPILPTEGAVTSPATTVAAFSHQQEHASPGRYQVVLGRTGSRPSPSRSPSPPGPASRASTFPAGTESNVLFKVADSINPVTAASVHVVGHDEVEGQVTSGQFCGTGTNYTLHFVARFDRPFTSAGTWSDAGVITRDHSLHRDHLRLLRDVRHDEGAAGAHEGRHLLRQHAGRAAEPPGRGSGLVGATRRRRGAGALERAARPHRRAGWHRRRAAHLLHGAVPLAPLPERGLRRVRSLRGKRRQGPHAAGTARCTPTSPSGTSTAARYSSRPSSTPTPWGTWSSRWSTTRSRRAGCPSGRSSAATSRR